MDELKELAGKTEINNLRIDEVIREMDTERDYVISPPDRPKSQFKSPIYGVKKGHLEHHRSPSSHRFLAFWSFLLNKIAHF